MNPFISIPRQALAELLKTCGSPLTPEQYVASLPELSTFKKYPSRAWAAIINKYCILVVTVLSVAFLPILGFDLENLIIIAGLAAVTFFEFRVHRYFLDCNPEAPSLGFRNQSCFAGAILIYCLYHAFSTFQMPADAMTMVEENNVIDPEMLKSVTRLFYLGIAVVAGGSQFALACYYRSAKNGA
jgi:hypothetical protein